MFEKELCDMSKQMQDVRTIKAHNLFAWTRTIASWHTRDIYSCCYAYQNIMPNYLRNDSLTNNYLIRTIFQMTKLKLISFNIHSTLNLYVRSWYFINNVFNMYANLRILLLCRPEIHTFKAVPLCALIFLMLTLKKGCLWASMRALDT